METYINQCRPKIKLVALFSLLFMAIAFSSPAKAYAPLPIHPVVKEAAAPMKVAYWRHRGWHHRWHRGGGWHRGWGWRHRGWGWHRGWRRW